MTQNTLRATVAALGAGIALSVATAAYAQPMPPPPPGPSHNCLPTAIRTLLPKYDRNHNGRLDPAEHHAMMRDQRRADFKKFDRDGDGRLSKTERDDLRHAKMVEHFEALDRNRNAEISRAEAKGSCTPVEWHFNQIDSDNDGSITWTEFAAAAKRHGPPCPLPPPGNRSPGPGNRSRGSFPPPPRN